MLDEITERIKKIPVLTESSEKESESSGDEILLNAVIALGVTVIGLILVIIFGCVKYVLRNKDNMEGEGLSIVRKATVMDEEQPEIPQEQHQPKKQVDISWEQSESQVPQRPIQVRKRSMTFSETDEECRKYREDLADSYNNNNNNNSYNTIFLKSLPRSGTVSYESHGIKLCWYHHNYGKKATKCKGRCDWDYSKFCWYHYNFGKKADDCKGRCDWDI